MNSGTMKRVAIVLSGAIAGLAAWGVFRLAGVELELNDRAPSDSVRAADVIVSTVLAGIAAWGAHKLLERWNRASLWPFVGSTALAISMIGPSWLADGSSAMALMAMHFVVGFVLIMGFAATGERSCDDRGFSLRRERRSNVPGHEAG